MKNKYYLSIIVTLIAIISAQAQKEEDCKTYNYGDYCFINSSEHVLEITVSGIVGISPDDKRAQTIILLPPGTNESCIYRVKDGVYHFTASIVPKEKPNHPGFNQEIYLQGEINIEECKTNKKEIKK